MQRERAELADAQDALGSLQEREKNLSWEAEVVRQKLERVRPESVGQAQRIPGMTPAAISLLLVHLARVKRSRVA